MRRSGRGVRGWGPVAVLGVLLLGCAGQREPAQSAIQAIEAVLAAVGSDAAKYVPDQWLQVEGEVEHLQKAYRDRDYAAVLAKAPAVLGAAHALASAAAARKDDVSSALSRRWSGLADVLPERLAALEGRMDAVQLNADRSLWSKAQAAFATGNLEEAVATATRLQTTLRSAAGAPGRAE